MLYILGIGKEHESDEINLDLVDTALELHNRLALKCPMGNGAKHSSNHFVIENERGKRTWTIHRTTPTPGNDITPSKIYIETGAESGLIYEYVRYVVDPNNTSLPVVREGVNTPQSWEITSDKGFDVVSAIQFAIAQIDNNPLAS